MAYLFTQPLECSNFATVYVHLYLFKIHLDIETLFADILAMAKVEPNDLISILKEKKIDEYRMIEQKKLLSQISEEEIKSKYESILSDIEEYEDLTLKKGVYFALLGALYAFKDRELDPVDRTHFPLFKVIREDIETVYGEISESLVDQETWLFEAFDYGIKHVYYLDWQLYLSKICY